MSVRQRVTQCLGEQFSEKPHSRPCNPTSRWLGHRICWHEEQESSELIQKTRSSAPVVSERIFRSRETVKAWLESSPISVLEDLDDESACPSSFESFTSSPALSVDHLSCTARFQNPAPKVNLPAHARSRTISPPRCPANKNSVDLSRIDPAHYSGGSFLMLAFKNAQYRGSSSPPAFQYTSGPLTGGHVQNLNAGEYGSVGSEFSLTSEWQNILAAGNAAGMSTRGSSGNNSEFEGPGEVLNASDVDLDSDVSNLCAHPQAVRKLYRRTRSMEIPRGSSGTDDLEDMLVEDNECTYVLVKPERRRTDRATIHDQIPLRRLSRRNSISSSDVREAVGEVEKRKVQSNAAAWKKAEYSKLISGCERESKASEDYQQEKATSIKQAELNLEANRAHLMQNDTAAAQRKTERARAEAKRAAKAARSAMEAKLLRRTGKVPRGCLFLV